MLVVNSEPENTDNIFSVRHLIEKQCAVNARYFYKRNKI